MKVLVTTPPFFIPPRGACEHDRLLGILQLGRLGHEVLVFSFLPTWQDQRIIEAAQSYLGCPVKFIDYRPVPPNTLPGAWHRILGLATRPALLDGSAFVYANESVFRSYRKVLRNWHPDVAWLDYTNLWPLLEVAEAEGVPTIVRSINYEPQHNLDERGRSLSNYVRYFGKYLSERASIQGACAFAAITPVDCEDYLRLGRTDCVVLPLRGLPEWIRPPRPASVKSPLDVFFFGSNYLVPHNRAAFEFIVRQIVPEIRRSAPGEFIFHLLGAKLPADLAFQGAPDIRVHGYVDELETFLSRMDIALIPSLYGRGMQQKIFEPLCRAFPLVVSRRGLAGYPVVPGEHALVADNLDGYVRELLSLRDANTRERLSRGASVFASQHFNVDRLNGTVTTLLNRASALSTSLM